MSKQYPLPSDTAEVAYKKLKAIVDSKEQVDTSLISTASIYGAGTHNKSQHNLKTYKVREYHGTHMSEEYKMNVVVELDYVWCICEKCGNQKRWSKVVASIDTPPLWYEHYFYKNTD